MEYMRFNGFLGKAVSRLINKGIENKFGIKPDIDISTLSLTTVDNEEYIQLEVSAFMRRQDFEKLIEEATK